MAILLIILLLLLLGGGLLLRAGSGMGCAALRRRSNWPSPDHPSGSVADRQPRRSADSLTSAIGTRVQQAWTCTHWSAGATGIGQSLASHVRHDLWTDRVVLPKARTEPLTTTRHYPKSHPLSPHSEGHALVLGSGVAMQGVMIPALWPFQRRATFFG